jgi:HPt (histidine-containing phosphotransfer) domain-containing protein
LSIEPRLPRGGIGQTGIPVEYTVELLSVLISFSAAARHAHAIAGAAGNLGADELRAAAKALELMARW